MALGVQTNSRVFIIRRISCHIRLDGNLWTVIFLNDPYLDLSEARFVCDIPGQVQQPVTSWVLDLINSDKSLIEDLRRDGFGFTARLLREIKTTWKLLLNELEVFLEQIVRLG